MMRIALLVILSFLWVGCPSTVIRETSVFKAEIQWFTQASTQQAQMLQHLLITHPECQCKDGEFVSSMCKEAAKLSLTAGIRAPYHKAMALYNAGIHKERPSKTPPVIPLSSTLCTKEATNNGGH